MLELTFDIYARKYNTIINGCFEKSILIDTTLVDKINKKNVVIFSHGFKGFKDWGPFNKIAEHFAVNGFCFCEIQLFTQWNIY